MDEGVFFDAEGHRFFMFFPPAVEKRYEIKSLNHFNSMVNTLVPKSAIRNPESAIEKSAIIKSLSNE
jgi:hypothetical protein